MGDNLQSFYYSFQILAENFVSCNIFSQNLYQTLEDIFIQSGKILLKFLQGRCKIDQFFSMENSQEFRSPWKW